VVASVVVEVAEVEPLVDSHREEVASEVVEAVVLPVVDEVLPEVGVLPVVLEVSLKRIASCRFYVAEWQIMDTQEDEVVLLDEVVSERREVLPSPSKTTSTMACLSPRARNTCWLPRTSYPETAFTERRGSPLPPPLLVSPAQLLIPATVSHCTDARDRFTVPLDGSEEKTEFRVWNPFRSKLAAGILGGLDNIHIKPGAKVLYLGAAS